MRRSSTRDDVDGGRVVITADTVSRRRRRKAESLMMLSAVGRETLRGRRQVGIFSVRSQGRQGQFYRCLSVAGFVCCTILPGRLVAWTLSSFALALSNHTCGLQSFYRGKGSLVLVHELQSQRMMEIKNEENEPPLRREDDENKEEAEDAPHLPPSHLEMEGNDQSIFRVNFPATDDESIPTDEENEVIVSKNNNIGPKGYDDSHNTLNQTYDMSSDEDDYFPLDKKEEEEVVAVMAVMANEATTASDGSLTAGGSVHPSKPGHETFDNFTQRQKLVGGILATIALSTIIIGVTIFKKENERKVHELLLHMESMPTTSPSNMPSLSLIPTGSAHPTSRPSIEPTLYPTISLQPFPRPSTMPSISIVPTISPSISFVPTKTSKPTTTPTQQPTSSKSRLKLYWQPGYLWQNINTEMFFCMECSNSNNACYQNDIIIINTCDTTASHQSFTIVGKTIRPERMTIAYALLSWGMVMILIMMVIQ